MVKPLKLEQAVPKMKPSRWLTLFLIAEQEAGLVAEAPSPLNPGDVANTSSLTKPSSPHFASMGSDMAPTSVFDSTLHFVLPDASGKVMASAVREVVDGNVFANLTVTVSIVVFSTTTGSALSEKRTGHDSPPSVLTNGDILRSGQSVGSMVPTMR